MNDLSFTDLLPELNLAQRKLLAEWLKANLLEPYITDIRLGVYAELRNRIDELIT